MESISISSGNTWAADPAIGYQIPREIILRAVGYRDPGSAGEETHSLIAEHLELAVSAAQPKAIYRATSFRLAGSDRVELPGGQVFTSAALYRAAAGCEGLIVGLVTLGAGTDQAIAAASRQDAFCGYLTDTISSLLVEMAAHCFWQHLVFELCQRGLKATSFISPGAADFPLHEQKQVFAFLNPKRIGVKLTESCLMEPSKSLTVIMGYGKQIVQAKYSHDCSTCDMADCVIRGIHIALAESNAG